LNPGFDLQLPQKAEKIRFGSVSGQLEDSLAASNPCKNKNTGLSKETA
jgi:hypothetical protein